MLNWIVILIIWPSKLFIRTKVIVDHIKKRRAKIYTEMCTVAKNSACAKNSQIVTCLPSGKHFFLSSLAWKPASTFIQFVIHCVIYVAQATGFYQATRHLHLWKERQSWFGKWAEGLRRMVFLFGYCCILLHPEMECNAFTLRCVFFANNQFIFQHFIMAILYWFLYLIMSKKVF